MRPGQGDLPPYGLPAPGVKENHRRQRGGEDSRQFDRHTVYIIERCFWELVSDSNLAIVIFSNNLDDGDPPAPARDASPR